MGRKVMEMRMYPEVHTVVGASLQPRGVEAQCPPPPQCNDSLYAPRAFPL
jgi:hypothetical protein